MIQSRFASILCKAATVVLVASLFGCESDQEAICSKMDECNLLSGVSEDDCVETVEKEASESQAADCADCVDDKSCSSLTNGACEAECSD
ncbi:MAG: hypothetical protein OXU20_42630 [Myxococcales bacterium]|nr:hypothetical protein [Myxococcales bacterium]MDD9968611.1 hypothetical protein [Myxococcales bacterium]